MKVKKNRKNAQSNINLCVSILRKRKRNYYKNLNEKHVTDKEIFWKANVRKQICLLEEIILS